MQKRIHRPMGLTIFSASAGAAGVLGSASFSAEAGISPRRATYFSCSRKQSRQKKRALLSVTSAPQALGQPVMLGRGACCGTRLRAPGRAPLGQPQQ
ncbi:MAG: hypothetical protein ACN6O3_07905, partial [Comamonas sp.]